MCVIHARRAADQIFKVSLFNSSSFLIIIEFYRSLDAGASSQVSPVSKVSDIVGRNLMLWLKEGALFSGSN